MKIIDIPEAVEVEGATKKLSFADFCIVAIDSFEGFGQGAKGIRQGLKIHSAIKSLNGEKKLTLEDDHFDALKLACERCKFTPQAARSFLPFFEALEKTQDVETPTKK